MRVVIFSLLLLSFSDLFCQNYRHIFELRGLEDAQGNTHLFYRYGYPGNPSFISCWSKSIYHFDLVGSSDTLFLWDSAGPDPFYGGCEGQWVGDFEFYNNDPSMYIYGGGDLWIDPIPFLIRYDGEIQIPAPTFGGITEIEISRQNENLVYAAIGGILIKSTDGGYNFVHLDSIQTVDYSIISLSRNNNSQIYGVDDNKLVRSEDEGQSYIIVDNNQLGNWNSERELYHDVDGQHIYYVVNSNSGGTLRISDSNGNPNSWNTNVTTPSNMSFTFDEENTGEIYYSFRKGIYKSIDYGASFLLYKELDRKITGLYKKSGSDILYVSTPLKIYEITPDSIETIKSLPVPEDEFAWFPLNLGDKWVHERKSIRSNGDSLTWISMLEIVGFKLYDGKVYNEMQVTEIYPDSGSYSESHFSYFRVDSSQGIIYRLFFANDSLWYDVFQMDLLVEVGDTIPHGYYLTNEEPFIQFGESTAKRTFQTLVSPDQQFVLVKGFGVVYDSVWSPVYTSRLKGCVIDGVVYGDTITVSVDGEVPSKPIEFSLSQNYPNPFNPTTKIRFTIPVVGDAKFASRTNVIIKVFDVLGKEVATLVNEEKPAGEYEVEFSAKGGYASGVYFYQLRAGLFVQTKKMVLLK